MLAAMTIFMVLWFGLVYWGLMPQQHDEISFSLVEETGVPGRRDNVQALPMAVAVSALILLWKVYI